MAPRKNPTKHHDTPNTPGVDESDIARLKADELRNRLKRRGVKGTADLKKPELVKKLVKALAAEDANGSKRSASPKKTLAKSPKASKSAKASKNPTSGNDTPDTPAVNESEIARMKAADLRRQLADRGVKGTDELKKPDLVKKMTEVLVAETETETKTRAPRSTVRTGRRAPSSLKYSQEITSTDDRPERAGRSLVTTDHEVIRQWAKARKAVPATVVGTEHGGHLGVLRFDFPGYAGDRLTEVSWDDWLATFDKRRLNFIYQEKLASGKRSNFFQLQSPDGVDD